MTRHGSTDRLQVQRFDDDGRFPNSRLPLLFYAGALSAETATAEAMEELLAAGGWVPMWRSSVFTYHHYHSTAHEALGIAAGEARLMLGGPKGQAFDVAAGDVVVIPAGVAHRRLSSSADFLVVGAYPPRQDWDLLQGAAGERPQADENIARVPLPPSDPVTGAPNPLFVHWS